MLSSIRITTTASRQPNTVKVLAVVVILNSADAMNVIANLNIFSSKLNDDEILFLKLTVVKLFKYCLISGYNGPLTIYCIKNIINTMLTLSTKLLLNWHTTPSIMHEKTSGSARLASVLFLNFLCTLNSFLAAIPEISPSTANIIPKYSDGIPMSCIMLLLSIVSDNITADMSAPKKIKFLSLGDLPNSLNELNKSLTSLCTP